MDALMVSSPWGDAPSLRRCDAHPVRGSVGHRSRALGIVLAGFVIGAALVAGSVGASGVGARGFAAHAGAARSEPQDCSPPRFNANAGGGGSWTGTVVGVSYVGG